MNVSLTKELEQIIDNKVNSGLYNNGSEVIRDALRRAFCPGPELDVEQDTPELAALLREGVESRHVRHKRGDILKILARTRAKLAR